MAMDISTTTHPTTGDPMVTNIIPAPAIMAP